MDIVNVDYKHAIKNHLAEHQTFYDVKNTIQRIPEFQLLKMDDELTLFVCKVVENLVKKKNKIDKKALVIRVLKDLFQLNEDEIKIIEKSIEFLWNNGKIKKTSTIKYLKRSGFAWISKKIL
jgi:hypothetical protein